ncbi:hypothetical protein LDL77_08445 [Flagellimonas marinaquae]|nr:hypothetical protein LDL77_08445 [Allomuricauda aquimarina]
MESLFWELSPSKQRILLISIKLRFERKEKNVNSEVQINFLNKTYEVVYLGNKVTKVYGYKILDSEISKLITRIVRANMEAIKSIYKDE